MNEVGGDQARLAFVPAGHGAFPSHRFERVEEGTTRVARDTMLNTHDLRNRGQRLDLGEAGTLAAIHGAHDEDGGFRKSGAHAANGLPKLPFIAAIDKSREAAF